MRFFTLDWWNGIRGDSDANPSDAYDRHLTSLRPLPDAVARLDQVPSLHDATVRRVAHLDGAVEIALDAVGEKGEQVPLRLSYGSVEALTIDADPDKSLSGPGGFGDLGYDEIDTPSAGVFEHRLLFSSGVELSVRFREFDFRVVPVQLSPRR